MKIFLLPQDLLFGKDGGRVSDSEKVLNLTYCVNEQDSLQPSSM